MNTSNAVNYYETVPRSRCELRAYARQWRKVTSTQNQYEFPIMPFLEYIMPQFNVGLKIIDDIEWNRNHPAGTHAFFTENTIYIKESVYDGAAEGKGRDRMTVAHEIAHALLVPYAPIKLFRSQNGMLPPAYKDPEWQAKCLAGELLVSYDLCKNMNAYEISIRCKVSLDAAQVQKNHF